MKHGLCEPSFNPCFIRGSCRASLRDGFGALPLGWSLDLRAKGGEFRGRFLLIFSRHRFERFGIDRLRAPLLQHCGYNLVTDLRVIPQELHRRFLAVAEALVLVTEVCAAL